MKEKVDMKEILLNNGGNTILENYIAMCANLSIDLDERTAILLYVTTFHASATFLKYNKQLAEVSILKYENPNNNEFLGAMIVTVDTDEEGNKTWNMSFTFYEEDLEIDENTRVYSTTSQEFINSYITTLQSHWHLEHVYAKEKLYAAISYPMIALKEFGDIYFSDRNNKDTEIRVSIRDCIDIEYFKESDGTVRIEPAFQSCFKQILKIEGKEGDKFPGKL